MREFVVPIEMVPNDPPLRGYQIAYGMYREEITRCRDCIYYAKDPNPIDPGWPMMCELTGMDMVSPNCFCCWAERREK